MKPIPPDGTEHTLARAAQVGTAGWVIPSASAAGFPGSGSHLERYARRFAAVEINSSFHRAHRFGTYRRWAQAVPCGFRFAIKIPKAITHARRLLDVDDLLDAFAAETAGLGGKFEVALVQLPPSFAFDAPLAEAFFAALRLRVDVLVACEPRHPSWFEETADECLAALRVARVAAHPVLAAGGERPGGWPGLRYHRLHGAPRTYHSSYEEVHLRELAIALESEDDLTVRRWCMFDNTASGAATADALALTAMLRSPQVG